MLETLDSSPITSPDLDLDQSAVAEPDWMVVVYDNDKNTYEEVVTILVLATGCDVEEAYIEAWEIDHYGQCVVHRASSGECRGVADVVATIGIRVEALPGD
ncbi:MAG: ATP-dependent Clp protease adaptor ClpS [Fimbriimonadaceae bacterium]|nr:ATP-dependent Clp protease adaptor ClpS [Fimbriimonadaceae bacterium]